MKRKCNKFLDVFTEFDLFAPSITIRYQNDNDYKTMTGAVLSLAIIIFFAVIFINRFTTMLNRTQITSSMLKQEQLDPSTYTTSTPTFLFAVGVLFLEIQFTGIDMNTGNRYFTVSATSTAVVNSTKTKTTIELGPCNYADWQLLGDQFGAVYNKLKLEKWLCPLPNQAIELQGKYSSDVFKYIKISVSDCTGTVNGQGCRTPLEISNYLAANEVFSYNFYYINTIVNPEQQVPTSTFLDDTNNFPFSTTIGTTCNFFLQSFTINTDHALLPIEQITTEHGGFAENPALSSSYMIAGTEYLRFYIRKSPTSIIYTRSFLRFDDLLSYIGGLFSLIAIVLQLPMTYYNTCCFELSLATDLFVYRKNKSLKNRTDAQTLGDNQPEGGSLQMIIHEKHNTNSDMKIEPAANTNNKRKKETDPEQDMLHSVENFNFFKYLGYVPFFALKRFGWKSLQSKWFTPYYEAIKQVRKQIDVGVLVQRMIYLERTEKCLLDDDQRRLIHLYPKQNIYQLKEHRSGIKLRDKLKDSIAKGEIQKILSTFLPDSINDQKEQLIPAGYDNLLRAYSRLKHRHDRVSRNILRSLDQQLIERFFQKQAVSAQELLPERVSVATNRREQKGQVSPSSKGNKVSNEQLNNQESIIAKQNQVLVANFEFVNQDELPKQSEI